jgi:hypothetical protein
MSRDFEDKERMAPADSEEVTSSETVPEEAHDETRRDFLTSLGKWSGAVIGLALLGAAVSSTDADADAETEGKPESSWRCYRCHRCRCRCRCVW